MTLAEKVAIIRDSIRPALRGEYGCMTCLDCDVVVRMGKDIVVAIHRVGLTPGEVDSFIEGNTTDRDGSKCSFATGGGAPLCQNAEEFLEAMEKLLKLKDVQSC